MHYLTEEAAHARPYCSLVSRRQAMSGARSLRSWSKRTLRWLPWIIGARAAHRNRPAGVGVAKQGGLLSADDVGNTVRRVTAQ